MELDQLGPGTRDCPSRKHRSAGPVRRLGRDQTHLRLFVLITEKWSSPAKAGSSRTLLCCRLSQPYPTYSCSRPSRRTCPQRPHQVTHRVSAADLASVRRPRVLKSFRSLPRWKPNPSSYAMDLDSPPAHSSRFAPHSGLREDCLQKRLHLLPWLLLFLPASRAVTKGYPGSSRSWPSHRQGHHSTSLRPSARSGAMKPQGRKRTPSAIRHQATER